MAKKKTTDAVVLTARQLLKGYTTDVDRKLLYNTSPYQMLPLEEKDDDWRKWNLDWLEQIGFQQIQAQGIKLKKNYDLANGIINKSDYVLTKENEFSSLVGIVGETNSPFSLKFYPIIPNVINVFQGEFSKRDNRIIVKAVDEYSQNDALDEKLNTVTQILVQEAQDKINQDLSDNNIDPNSQEAQQRMQTAQALAEAETKFKNYRGIAEEWGQHIIDSDNERFRLYEMEADGFRDSLIADREFWHINLKENDYDVELWNPLTTFYHKSPDIKYISEGNYVGQILMMSIPDVIDMYGSMMSFEQIDSLKTAQDLAISGMNAIDDTRKHDSTEYWDASKPYKDQSKLSIHTEQYLGVKDMANRINNVTSNGTAPGDFSWNKLANMPTDNFSSQSLVRVTHAYWKSQRKVGELTRIDEDGILTKEIIDETYQVTYKPVYDKSIVNKEQADNLICGEHIDWMWINEIWRGIKIGPNDSTFFTTKGFGFDPIYLKIEPLPFQFKGQNNLYGTKLPVEGRIFSDRNSMSTSLVDRMKSNQIGFNIVNNQVMDFLADEVGKVILIDPNMIPRNSFGGSWGKHNFPRFMQVMKDYQIAPVDSSLQNTEQPATSFNHFQAVDLSKTDQILARLKLAEYFKNEAFSIVGITPQRLGSVAASESATGVQQAVNNSYAQTETYFDQHINQLMPRVRQMMLEAAQFVTAEEIRGNGKSRLTYMNKNEEKIWFEIELDNLLLRDYDIYPMSRANTKELVERLRQLAVQNNTAGGSLYDLAQMVTLESPSQIISKLKEADDKRAEQEQQKAQQEQQMQQQQQAFEAEQMKAQQAHDDYWKERQLQAQIYEAEIKTMGFAKNTDVNSDAVPDALEVSKFMDSQNQHAQDQLLKREQLTQSDRQHQDKINIDQKKLAMEKYKADKAVEVAKVNKPSKTKK